MDLAAVIQQNNELLQELIAEQRETNRLLRREQRDWLDPDEACRRLGIPLSASGQHRRRLSWLRRHGFLTEFGSRRPYTYSARQINEVAEKIRQGKIFVPG